MKTSIEWRLRAVTRYLLTRYEKPVEPDNGGMLHGTTVQPAGEFDSLALAMQIGEAMALKDRLALNLTSPDTVVEFDGASLPFPKVRAKMRCASRQPFRDSAWGGDRDGGNITLNAVYESGAEDGGNAALENRIFSKATPCASVQMQIDNPDAFGRFKLGRDYYVDFIPCPQGDDALLID